MNENKFWEIIERANSVENTDEEKAQFIIELLSEELEEDIIEFSNIYRRKMAKACSFDILAANFIIRGYVSDDVFEDFRAWLVAQGKDRFEKVIKNPEDITDFLTQEDVNKMQGEDYLFVARNAYLKKKNIEEDSEEADEFDDMEEYIDEPDFEDKWPDNLADLRNQYPKLYDKLWNQKRHDFINNKRNDL